MYLYVCWSCVITLASHGMLVTCVSEDVFCIYWSIQQNNFSIIYTFSSQICRCYSGVKMIVMPIWTRNSIYEKEIYDLKKSFYGELYWCLLLVWPHLAPCTCCTLHLRPRRTNYVTMRSRWLNMKKRRALMLCEAEDIWGRQQIGQKIRIFLPVPSKTLSGTRPCRQVWLWLTHH